MKIQCDVCEKAEAMVLCCADEAALCYSCDQKVHAANKLAEKHQRIPLTNHNQQNQPICDLCQEKTGYFFCLEDRALLCRHCDVSIHTATQLVSSHQRFLLTGVKLDDFQHQQQNIINNKPSNFSHLNSSTRLNVNASPTVNLSPTNMNINLDAQQHWPSDEIAATASTDFEHYYEFEPSELGSSTISSQ